MEDKTNKRIVYTLLVLILIGLLWWLPKSKHVFSETEREMLQKQIKDTIEYFNDANELIRKSKDNLEQRVDSLTAVISQDKNKGADEQYILLFNEYSKIYENYKSLRKAVKNLQDKNGQKVEFDLDDYPIEDKIPFK